MNIEHRMGKDEETEFKKPELLDEKKPRLGVVECSVLGVCFFIRCWNNLRSGATSLFDVRRSMFDVGRSSFNMFDIRYSKYIPKYYLAA